MKDSYETFFRKKYITKEQFFQFGLEESIYIDTKKAKDGWDTLKKEVLQNQQVYIRGYGRNGTGSQLLVDFYKELLGNENIKVDPTNNTIPERTLNLYTQYRKNITEDSKNLEKIQNYQISHIFGKTKNPFLFSAPWNIAYIPKLIDPFTGHEARGELPREYTKAFKGKAFDLFGELIEDYNQLIKSLSIEEKINEYFNKLEANEELNANKIMKFKKDIKNEFSSLVKEN